MKQQVNYIKHLSWIHEKFAQDERLNPWHISLYYALFHSWNFNQFSNDFQIVREVIMSEAKIGSANTYTKCLKELHDWGYIHYIPSFNRYKSSCVSIITFDKGSDKGNDKGTDNGSDKGSDNGAVMPVRPLIKQYKTNTNNTNTNSIELVNDKKAKNEKRISKKVKTENEKPYTSTPKNLEEVESYFQEKQKPISEAHKFFNYYQANGWMVGKNKMKNWRAAANNWILNANKFQKQDLEKINAYLNVDQDKNYAIPL